MLVVADGGEACLDAGSTTWNPILSAPSHSQFAGVVAGFVFAAVVLVLSDGSRKDTRDLALLPLVPTFLALLVGSFGFSVVAGERDCAAAAVDTYVMSGLFAAGALGTMYSLCWLFAVYGGTTLVRVAVRATSAAAVVIAVQMGTALVDFQGQYDTGMPGRELLLPVVVAVGLVVVAVSWPSWSWSATIRERRSSQESRPRVDLSANLLIGSTLLSAILFGLTGDQADVLGRVFVRVAYAVTSVASVVVLLTMLRTLPEGEVAPDGGGASGREVATGT